MIQFDGHTATVCSLAFSPDSMNLASGAKDGSLTLWDAAGGAVGTVGGDQHTPRKALAWSPRGDTLATSGHWRMTLFRDGPNWKEKACPAIAGDVTCLAFLTPNLLAVGTAAGGGGHPGTLHLWDPLAHASRPVPTQIRGAHGVRAVAAHPPTKRLHWIAGTPYSTACVWRSWCITSPNATDVNLGKPASDICASSDGGTVAIACDWIVRVFAADGKPRATLTGHTGQVAGVGFVHGGRTVVTASWDETVRFWDVATGKETARFPLAVGQLTSLAVSPDGTRIAVGGTTGPIVVIDAE